jgi:hypothetical protein
MLIIDLDRRARVMVCVRAYEYEYNELKGSFSAPLCNVTCKPVYK